MEVVTRTAQQLTQPVGSITRRRIDRGADRAFFLIALLPLLLMLIMIVVLALRARSILATRSLGDLLTGQVWKPAEGLFGFAPFIVGTVWVTLAAMIIAVPICALCALHLSEYASPRLRGAMKPLLDILAAIPSVIYGVWGLIVIVPFAQSAAPVFERWLGFIPLFHSHNPTGFSVLAAGLVLAVMVTPVIIAVTYEVLQTVPQGLREASLAVGATRWQTIKHVVIPKALPGIIAAIVLGFSRAFGETIAVMMVVGNVTQAPASIFDPAYPLPALIANNYGEVMSIPQYDAALMGAALILLLVVLLFNLIAVQALRRAARRAV
jgi:phosphate transport system permease protein